jgi:cytochrome P450
MDVAVSPEAEAVARAVHGAVDPADRSDPYSSYTVLRQAGPFVPTPLGLHFVPGYADCDAILQNPAWSHAEESQLLHPDSDVELPGSFLWMEPPDHTRLRGLVSKAFTARTVDGMRARAEVLTEQLVGAALRDGEVDLLEALAYPLPLAIICELLGVPEAEHGTVRRMSAAIARGLDPDVLQTPAELAARSAAVRQFLEFFGGLVALRRADPRDDLITALAHAETGGDRLTTTEMLGTLLILVVAGHETTVNLIGNGVLALIRHPGEFDRLRRDPSLAAPAADELLRYDAPVHLTTRTARAELTVGGRAFRPGEAVILLLGSANRDPAAFTDPDRLDVGRYRAGGPGAPRPNRHLSFGLGLHYCLGAPLARLEMEVALRSIATRVAGLELLDAAPRYRPNLVVRGLASLPVRLCAAGGAS